MKRYGILSLNIVGMPCLLFTLLVPRPLRHRVKVGGKAGHTGVSTIVLLANKQRRGSKMRGCDMCEITGL